MGYTHYFRTHKNGIPESAWEKIVADVRKLLSNLPAHSTNGGGYHATHPLELAWEHDSDKAPEVSDSLIRFNGKDGGNDLGHETFSFERVPEPEPWQTVGDDNTVFTFCKTARKPYDLAVCGVLLVVNFHAPEYVSISSDGEREDWKPAVEWVEATLGRHYPLPASLWVGTGSEPLPEPPSGTEGQDRESYDPTPTEERLDEIVATYVPPEPEPEPVTTSHTFIVDAKELRTVLELAVTEKKTTIPALSNVCLVPQGSTLQVLSTDLDKWTVTELAAMFDDGAESFLLPHRKTLELLKGESGIARITAKITTHKERFTHAWVNLHVGGCEYDLPSLSRANFPELPKSPKVGFTVPGADLKASLSRTMCAISTEESRYTLNGSLFEQAANKLTIVATDGHRLALDSIQLTKGRKDSKAVIHHEALNWLHKQSKGDVNISLGEEYSFFHVADSRTTLIARNVTGQFPNYHAIIPRADSFNLTASFASADELAKTLVKVARMADERSGAVKFRINGACTLSAESSETGKASATVKASVNHSEGVDEITMGFNSAYVLDALKVAGKNPVALSLKSAGYAGVFTVPSLPEYSYILMPMRI